MVSRSSFQRSSARTFFLQGVIVGHGESAQLVEGEPTDAAELEQLRADGGELEAPAHDTRGDAEPHGDIFDAHVVIVVKGDEGVVIVGGRQPYPQERSNTSRLWREAARPFLKSAANTRSIASESIEIQRK